MAKKTQREGPFDQAAGALFALKTALNKKFSWCNRVSFASGVVMPDITFSYRGVSVIPEILYDYASSFSFDEYILKCHTYWNERNKKDIAPLSDEEVEFIKQFIRDDLHFVPAVGCIAESIDEQLIRLTQEQISVLDSLDENKKLLINGPAGSGKTLIAVNYAQKCIKNGKRVLFLTYNKILATYLSNVYSDNGLNIKHFHGLISEYIPIDVNKSSDSNYYYKTLPEQFLKYITSHSLIKYDVLIVDEGQDLLNEKYLPIFDNLLKNGLFNGKWIFFYDNNQNLFNRKNFEKTLNLIDKYFPVKYKLTRNCRNTEPIAKFNNYISGINSGKAIVDGEHVELCELNENGFDVELDGNIDRLLSSGISMDEIVILSPYIYEHSIMREYNGKYKNEIENFTGIINKNKIYFSTIQAYKGLDSKVVIVVDISKEKLENESILLYTLLSRARTLLYVISDKETSLEMKYKVLSNI